VRTFTLEFTDAARPAAGRTSTARSISTDRSSTCWSRPDAMPRQQERSSLALRVAPAPVEVRTDEAPVCPRVIDERAAAARHITEQYATDENVNSGASRVLFCAAFWSAVAA
jgi:hypothetical protein